MASVVRYRDGWRAYVYVNGKRKAKAFRLRSEASRWAAQVETIGSQATFTAVAEQFLALKLPKLDNATNPLCSISNNTLLFALYRLGYRGRMTGHGFRAVASTILNESGLWSRDAIERQLAHRESDQVRAAYMRAEFLPERTRLMAWYSDHLVALTNSTGMPAA